MGQLRRRLIALERSHRDAPREPCPEHLVQRRPWRERFFEGLALFSPDDAERGAAEAGQEAEANQPPCSRCGWTPFVLIVRADPNWGKHEPE